MFPPSQRAQFPRHYRPSSGVAYFLMPEGVPLEDVLDCYRDLTQQLKKGAPSPASSHSATEDEGNADADSLRRDFAADYILWSRAALEDFVEDHVIRGVVLGQARHAQARGAKGGQDISRFRQKNFKKWTRRETLLEDAVVRDLFLLGPHLPPTPPSLPGKEAASPPSPHIQKREREEVLPPCVYRFTPHAALQQLALRPLAACRSPQDRVRFTTFPQIHNVFRQEVDSMSALRTLSHYAGDTLVYTREAVLHLAMYLQRALAEIEEREKSFAGPHYDPAAAAERRGAPILTFFGNGRLAHELNATGVLPRQVVSVRLRHHAIQDKKARRLAQQEMEKGTSVLPECGAFRSAVHSSFASSSFPCQVVPSVAAAMRAYQPALVVVEPHRGGRDYFADIRGYFTVRRVVAMGPLDGPAMGSMWFPFLSFGVSPSPATYLVYNEHLQQVSAASRVQMPVDPPHEAQGYVKKYLDAELSHWLISPNDTAAVPHQYRAMVFERTVFPVRKSCAQTPESPAKTGEAEAHPKEK